MRPAESRRTVSIMINNLTILSLTGEQVGWIMNTSRERSDDLSRMK